MPFDIAIDKETGDWLFGPTLDLIGVTGPELDVQRINIRSRIPRGSFTYDENGSLGSFLHLISRNPSPKQLSDARAYMVEALQDMDGISVIQIDTSSDEIGQLLIDVKFEQTGDLEAELSTEFEDSADAPEFDARVTFNSTD